MAISLTIDGHPVDIEPGQTILHAARKLGIDVPTLCYLEKCGPMTSCLACVVKLKANGQERIVPSCGMPATDGMVVESESADVHEARRIALELLLSDHVGDCLSPCQRLCPLQLSIPPLLRHVGAEHSVEAMTLVRDALPLPAVISRLCHAPCENGCRRGTADSAVAIRQIEQAVADNLLEWQPVDQPIRRTGHRVAIVGSGPTALAAAFTLARRGHHCTVFDRHPRCGGTLRSVDEASLPARVLDAELEQLRRLGVEFRPGFELGKSGTIDTLLAEFAAVLLCPGETTRADVSSLGLTPSATGIKTDAETFQTSADRVFAAGAAVKPVKQIVRAMSDGMNAAECIHQFISGAIIRRPGKPFSSIMGRLEKSELDMFLTQGSPCARHECQEPVSGYRQDEAVAEAARCVHCDCRAAGNCGLQHYATVYGADAGRFRERRRHFEWHRQHGEVIYEPGKCIRCGICVKITEQEREPLGLTFVGRGFDVQIAAPLNKTIAEGLQKTAQDCVEACPTGALAFDEKAVGRVLNHEGHREHGERGTETGIRF